MPVFAANLTTMFTEWDFLDRFAAAADHGFEAVECQFLYDHPPDAIAQRLERERLTFALFNAPGGDDAAGGLAALPDRAEAFRASIAQAKIYAEHTGVQAVHVLAGIARADDPAARRVYMEALRFALERLDPVMVCIEPLNEFDAPGYYLDSFDTAAKIVAEIGHPRLRLQYDVYHRQRLAGEVLNSLTEFMPLIGHVQIAAAPRTRRAGHRRTQRRPRLRPP